MSTSFDRAADVYEATRGFPPGIADQVVGALMDDWLSPRARVLEVGVGTGRIARPLAALGPRVVGLDLSSRMMAELQRRVTSPARPSLIRGDATRVPIHDQAVDAVLGVHVFHLIPDWMSVLAEARRVLVPGGLLITGYDWSAPGAPRERVFGLWREILAGMGYSGEYPGARDYSDVHASLVAQGATVVERMVGEWTVARTPGQLIESIEHRSWSSTWGVPDTLFPEALAQLRQRVRADLGPPDTVFTVTHRFRWQAYRFQH